MNTEIISREKFKDVFERLGWIHSTSKSGKYDLWTFDKNKKIWATLPRDQETIEYIFNQDKNIRMLVYALGLPDNEISFQLIHAQLVSYNYKLINRIVNKKSFSQEVVPYELATAVPSKNIDAFRSFFLFKKHGKESLSLDKFQLNHTEHGSFIIPISIQAEAGERSLVPLASTTSILIREYLDTIDRLVKIDPGDKEKYGKKIVEEGIDSKLVKDFLNTKDSIAKYREKYHETVKEISITSQSNPILDYHLTDEHRSFKKVELGTLNPLPDEYIQYIEKLEEEADFASRKDIDAKIEAAVDSIDTNGTAKFTVFSINSEEIKKPFKARTTQLPTVFLNLCAQAFISREKISINGDLTKGRGKIGTIITSNLLRESVNQGLFSEIK